MGSYKGLSESAHPNWEGVCLGYSTIDSENYTTNFGNCWVENFGNAQGAIVEIIMRIFEAEYNDIWPKNFAELENWIQENDKALEASKDSI